MDSIRANVDLAPPPSIAVKAIIRSARLEAHLGTLVGAIAATIGAAWNELQEGKLTSLTQGQGGELIYELFKLRRILLADFPNFDDLAPQCGVETLLARGVPSEVAKFLVDETMRLLARVVERTAS